MTVSVYDTSPVHFLLMTFMSIVWVMKTRMVFDRETGSMNPMNFLCLNDNDEYNKKMNDVDIINQLRNQYRINCYIQKYKWLWDLLCWCHDIMIVNSYFLYKSLLIHKGRKLLSRYEFRNQAILKNLDLENYDLRETVVEKRVMKREAQQISKRYEKEAAVSIKGALEKYT